MTLDEFQNETTQVNKTTQYVEIASVMKKLFEMNVKDIHSEKDDPYKELWEVVTRDWDGKTYSDWIDDAIEYMDDYDNYLARLPYKAENMLYRLSLIPNSYVCDEACPDDESPRSILNKFFRIRLDDYISFVRKYACKGFYHGNYRTAEMGETIGEIIMNANRMWYNGVISNTDSKEAVLYLLVYAIGFCFCLEDGKEKMNQLLNDIKI